MSQDVEAAETSSPLIHKEKRNKGDKKKRKREAIIAESHTTSSPTKRTKSHNSRLNLSKDPGQQTLEQSPFSTTRFSLYLPLAPVSQLHPIPGICAEHLSPLILTYYPPLKGVVLSYTNVTLSETLDGSESSQPDGITLAKTIDEFAASFVWVTADFLLLKSQKGATIEGQINLQNESHIGLICFNLFNASIPRKRLPKGWKWTGPDLGTRGRRKLKKPDEPASEAENDSATFDTTAYSQDHDEHFVDEEGKRVEGTLKLRIKDLDTSSSSDKEKAFVSIEGTLLTDHEEAELDEIEALKISKKDSAKASSQYVMSGAQVDETDGAEIGAGELRSKHRVRY